MISTLEIKIDTRYLLATMMLRDIRYLITLKRSQELSTKITLNRNKEDEAGDNTGRLSDSKEGEF